MAPERDYSFPCFFWLPDRLSVQDKRFEERPCSDYVFFSPSVDSRRSEERSLNPESLGGDHRRSRQVFLADACDLLSRNQSGGAADVLSLRMRRPES